MKRVRVLPLIIAALLILVPFVMVGAADFTGYSDHMRKILERDQLIFAMTKADQFPFYFVDSSGTLRGLDVDLARGIATELLGDPAKAVFLRTAENFNAVVDQVVSGEADIAVSKLSLTLARARKIIYSEPYITFRHSLLVNRLALAQVTTEDKLPQYIRAFKGKIGVIKASSYVGYAAKYFPDATIVEYPTWEGAVAAVFAGEVMAVYRDELEIQKILDAREDASISLKAILLTDLIDPIAIGVAWDRSQLRDWINVYLTRNPVRLGIKALLAHYSTPGDAK